MSNPFKMLGSWIGAIIPFVFFIVYWNFFICVPEGGDFGVKGCIILTSIEGVAATILGFLVGWIIHILIRKVRGR